MNKLRRKDLARAAELIEEAKGIIEQAMEEETEYADNMPENLQGSEKHETAEEVSETLQSSMDALDESLQYLETAGE